MRARFEQSRGVWFLIVITSAVFVIDIAMGLTITEFGAKSSAIWSGQVHRLIVATFLHGGITHIVFNMYALFVFGQVTERLLGTRRFLALYILSGAIGYIASLLFAPHNLAVGASASIFGLMGYVLHFRLRRMPLQWNSLDAAFLQIFLINLLMGLMVPNIDHWAHLGGLFGGVLCGSLLGFDPWSPGRNTASRRETGAAAVLLALILFIGLRPLDAATVVQRFVPALGQSMHAKYDRYFFPYQIVSPTIVWRYDDEEGEWEEAGELLDVEADRPVALAVFWRWEPGAKFVPGTPHDYTTVWRFNGETLARETRFVWAPDPPEPPGRKTIRWQSGLSPRPGSILRGNWEVRVTMFDTEVVHLRVRVVSG